VVEWSAFAQSLFRGGRAHEIEDEEMAEMKKLAIHKGKDAEIELGGLRFRACRREIDDIDGGVTLQVLGSVGAEETELLRFDCFRKAPHYHAPAENAQETKIDAAAFGDGRAWVFEELTNNLGSLLDQGGFTELSQRLDASSFADAGSRLAELFAALPEPSETSYFEVDPAALGLEAAK
jgi:hypothetical protein